MAFNDADGGPVEYCYEIKALQEGETILILERRNIAEDFTEDEMIYTISVDENLNVSVSME